MPVSSNPPFISSFFGFYILLIINLNNNGRRKKCHFMDGSCLASPRWVSLLVAELFYPHARFPGTKPGKNWFR